MTDFAVEQLDRAMGDVQSLLPEQWAHTGDVGIECQPNWNFYRQMETAGALSLVMARQHGEPVGYMAVCVYPHPNSVTSKVASIQTYFVRDGRDRVFVLNSMIDYVLERLAAAGIFKVTAETSAEFSAGRLWEMKGFKVVKIGYSLQLKCPVEKQNA